MSDGPIVWDGWLAKAGLHGGLESMVVVIRPLRTFRGRLPG